VIARKVYEIWYEIDGEKKYEGTVDTEEEADELTWDLVYENCCADVAWIVEKVNNEER
jgi:hypothetical protein